MEDKEKIVRGERKVKNEDIYMISALSDLIIPNE